MGHARARDWLYLTKAEVALALADVDPVEVATRTFLDHAAGRTELPDEAYLGWRTAAGEPARSLSMPGMLDGDVAAAGVKIINASLGNVARGLPRADGVTILFDRETARPVALMDAALVSATRTAAVSVVSVRAFASHPVRSLALIGCGMQAATHLRLFLASIPSIGQVRVYDRRDAAMTAFVAEQGEHAAAHGAVLDRAPSAETAIAGADVVVPVTTVTEGYIEHAWLSPDAIVVHVSLDDLLPEVVLRAGTVVVDDWDLVKADHRRLLGRMYRQGLLCGPDEEPGGGARKVDGEIGTFLAADDRPRASGGLTVVNPFGMAIHDIALASHVLAAATGRGLGTRLPR